MSTHNQEAMTLLNKKLDNYRTLSYEELKDWVRQKKVAAFTVIGKDKTEYQIELSARWDDKVDGAIRLSGSIDTGVFSWRRLFKSDITQSFIKNPDGTFIGE